MSSSPFPSSLATRTKRSVPDSSGACPPLPGVQGDSSFIIVRSESWMRCALQAVVTSSRVRGNKKRREMELILLSGEPLTGPRAIHDTRPKDGQCKEGEGKGFYSTFLACAIWQMQFNFCTPC